MLGGFVVITTYQLKVSIAPFALVFKSTTFRLSVIILESISDQF